MTFAEIYAVVIRVSLWGQGLLNNELQQEMALKNLLFIFSMSGAYDMYKWYSISICKLFINQSIQHYHQGLELPGIDMGFPIPFPPNTTTVLPLGIRSVLYTHWGAYVRHPDREYLSEGKLGG